MPERPPQNTELAEKEAEYQQTVIQYNGQLKEIKDLYEKLDGIKETVARPGPLEARRAAARELTEGTVKAGKLLERLAELWAELEALGSSIVGGDE